MSYAPFTGKSKFFVENENVFAGYDIYGQPIYKNEFKMTSNYYNYLQDKANHEKQKEFEQLKAKLQYEYTTYGEVDPVDYTRFQQMLVNQGVKIPN